MRNQHGLSRTIPAAVKREVRQRSKFGCVICRCAIYEYEHIVPFSEITSHDPNDICLLCGRCHGKVTRGQLSKETIRYHYNRTSYSDDISPPYEYLDVRSNKFRMNMGSAEFAIPSRVIRVNNYNILSINLPHSGVECFPEMSGSFADNHGNVILSIDKVEWFGSLECADIETIGSSIVIRTADRQQSLRIDVNPPHCLQVRALNMYCMGAHIVVHNNTLMVGREFGPNMWVFVGVPNLLLPMGDNVLLDIDTTAGVDPIRATNCSMTHEGIWLPYLGVRIGSAGSGMAIRGFEMYVSDNVSALLEQVRVLVASDQESSSGS